MQSSWATTTLILKRLVLASMLLVSISSCRTGWAQWDRVPLSPAQWDPVPLSPSVRHDTVYQGLKQKDSIYITDSSSERYALAVPHYDTLARTYIKVDTLYREKLKTVYRLQLLHDTLYLHQQDTIPKIVTLVKTEKVKYVPKVCKFFSYIGLIAMLVLGIRIYHRFR